MRYTLIFIAMFFMHQGFAQMSDFLTVKKKNNKPVKTFMPGTPISFTTIYGHGVSGWITDIRNDTLFIKMYDIRTLPTQFGTTRVDTVGSYNMGVHHKDIFKIDIDKRAPFKFITNGTLFMLGGAAYAALNVFNGAFLNEPITDPENLKSLGIALGVAGVGYLLNRIDHKKEKTGKKYKIEYVRMNNPSIQKARNSF